MVFSGGVLIYFKLILLYLLLINILGFAVMGYDKSAARKGARRILEQTLFFIAILGGSFGSFLGMRVFRHKTKHWYFKYGLPLLIVIHIFLITYLLTLKQ